jgi:predicted metalloprotease with PDZ domain
MIHKWLNAERFPLHDYTGFGYCAAEGFTDYLARYIMLNNGIISRQEYVEDMNGNIQSCIQSSQINATADFIRKNFWQDLRVMKIPYRRGDLLAHLWSNEIRKHTGGKHDFATALRDIIRQHSQTVIFDQIFAAALEPYIGRNVIDDILRYMKNGETIPIPEDLIPFARLSPRQDSTGAPQFEFISESK